MRQSIQQEESKPMSLIQIKNLTFSYDNGGLPVFDHVSLSLDTNWKLGMIGRNGRGKTTLLRLLHGDYASPLNIFHIRLQSRSGWQFKSLRRRLRKQSSGRLSGSFPFYRRTAKFFGGLLTRSATGNKSNCCLPPCFCGRITFFSSTSRPIIWMRWGARQSPPI